MRRLLQYLPIVALFLGLGMANALLYYMVAKAELEWGVEEQVKGRAIALAGLYPQAATDAGEAARVGAALERISKQAGGLDAVRFEKSASGWSPTLLSDHGDVPSPDAPEEVVIEQLSQGAAVARILRRPEASSDLAIAYAARTDRHGIVRRVFAVSTEELGLRVGLETILANCGWFLLAALFAGVLVAEMVSRISRSALGRLEIEAAALEAGDFQPDWQPSRIAELNDLTGTLKTIAIVLQENVRQTWRRFQQDELLPGQEEIASDYQALADVQKKGDSERVRWCWRRIGRGSLDDFVLIHREGDVWLLGVARLAAPIETCTSLDRVVRADAARESLRGLCLKVEKGNPWERLNRIFPLLKGELVRIEGSGQRSAYAFQGGGAASASDARFTTDARGVLGTIEDTALARASDYLRTHTHQTAETAIDALQAAMSDEESGHLLIFEHISENR